jgi:hypothetical protein
MDTPALYVSYGRAFRLAICHVDISHRSNFTSCLTLLPVSDLIFVPFRFIFYMLSMRLLSATIFSASYADQRKSYCGAERLTGTPPPTELMASPFRTWMFPYWPSFTKSYTNVKTTEYLQILTFNFAQTRLWALKRSAVINDKTWKVKSL